MFAFNIIFNDGDRTKTEIKKGSQPKWVDKIIPKDSVISTVQFMYDRDNCLLLGLKLLDSNNKILISAGKKLIRLLIMEIEIYV